uniref:NADH-ubiquinone oxidoreductase chain 6 n=1 Tax=Pentatomidae sp. GM-2014 TaxID=1651278 RepID=A0A0A0V991_9HEMI|nr:NADH dehydrogenase subunit 6 [Pentatomidae sp. GM-2014]AIW65014.1 NADH dehydrogenase subunit 6 [Pentatomidae sp. GM-2014]
MNMLMSMIMINSFIMLWMKHPLSLGLTLILQTLMIATITGYMMKSFFFSYIIIIIMLSGTLVLFIYMASVASNEKFNSPVKLMISSLILFLIMLCLMINYNNMYIMNQIYTNEIMSLIKMFSMSITHLTLMVMFYLLMTMIVVSNIAKVSEGPLRVNQVKKYE